MFPHPTYKTYFHLYKMEPFFSFSAIFPIHFTCAILPPGGPLPILYSIHHHVLNLAFKDQRYLKPPIRPSKALQGLSEFISLCLSLSSFHDFSLIPFPLSHQPSNHIFSHFHPFSSVILFPFFYTLHIANRYHNHHYSSGSAPLVASTSAISSNPSNFNLSTERIQAYIS